MIFNYFRKLKNKIEKYDHIIASKTTSEKTYSNKKGFIEGEIYFIDDSRLDFTEVKEIEKDEKVKYSYHYMNSENEMQFRYDNTKHFPDISTFPHHKHTNNGVIESKEPEINHILDEVEGVVIKK